MRVYVGSEPDGEFDVVISHGVQPGGVVGRSVVEALVEESRPALDRLIVDSVGALVRDEFVALVRSVAAIEAARSLLGSEIESVTSRSSMSRPTRPGRLGDGLAELTGRPHLSVGRAVPDRVPGWSVAAARAARWSVLPAAQPTNSIVLAIGGPSELRALEPVRRVLQERGAAVELVDFATKPLGHPSLARPGLTAKHDAAALKAVLIESWSTDDWWGARWTPWVRRSLDAIATIVGREAAVFSAGAEAVFVDADVVVTAKSQWSRARALVGAASRLDVPIVATQHGVHIDALEWEGITADTYGTCGQSFSDVLVERGFAGTVVETGAPFFTSMDATHDVVIALRPVEGSVLRSDSDYLHHLDAAVTATSAHAAAGATVALRTHPREHPTAAAREILTRHNVVVDAAAVGHLWVAVESSVVAQAALSGGRIVQFSLNGHEWVHDFHQMSGVGTARSAEELDVAISEALSAGAVDVSGWQSAHGVKLGDDAGKALADEIQSLSRR